MDRVESVVKIDINKALKVGADEVVSTIKKGEFLHGAWEQKVYEDICVACGNRARTRADYCVHMKKYPRTIITEEMLRSKDFKDVSPDKLGVMICVDNPCPKFFDFLVFG